MTDPHTLWATAQLVPGEGIEDGVARIAALLAEDRDCRTCGHAGTTKVRPVCGICTNGDRYDPLPVVRLWRDNAAMTGPEGVQVHEPVGQKPVTEGEK